MFELSFRCEDTTVCAQPLHCFFDGIYFMWIERCVRSVIISGSYNAALPICSRVAAAGVPQHECSLEEFDTKNRHLQLVGSEFKDFVWILTRFSCVFVFVFGFFVCLFVCLCSSRPSSFIVKRIQSLFRFGTLDFVRQGVGGFARRRKSCIINRSNSLRVCCSSVATTLRVTSFF